MASSDDEEMMSGTYIKGLMSLMDNNTEKKSPQKDALVKKEDIDEKKDPEKKDPEKRSALPTPKQTTTMTV